MAAGLTALPQAPSWLQVAGGGPPKKGKEKERRVDKRERKGEGYKKERRQGRRLRKEGRKRQTVGKQGRMGGGIEKRKYEGREEGWTPPILSLIHI